MKPSNETYGRAYTGQILWVNLSNRELNPTPLNMEWAHDFVGGKGLGARYFYEVQKPHTDPFASDNHLVFMTGPLTGTIASTMSRIAVITRSPLTGTFLDSYAGGYFPAELKFAGFDGLIITGKADRPVWLWIKDRSSELRDASDLWGRDTFFTIDSILQELGEPKRQTLDQPKIATIGPAGENRVRFGCICFDRHHFAGRGGTGAVMGSKNLKAIAVRGTNGPSSLDANHDTAYAELIREVIKTEIRENPDNDWAIKYGTPLYVETSNEAGLIPVRNFQSGVYPLVDEIGSDAMRRKILIKHFSSCFDCAIACRNETEIREGKFAGLHGEGPEYQTLAMCGSNVDVGDIYVIAKFNQECSMMGLDTISTGNVVGWAMELYERGILTRDDTENLDLRFGNLDAYISMPEIIAYRKKIGNILAEGVMRASETIARGSERYALHVKGLEYPGYDPRGSFGMALAYATSDRGACHERAWPVSHEAFGDMGPFTTKGKAEIVISDQIERSIRWSLVACQFYSMSYAMMAKLLSAAVQSSYSSADMLDAGKRVWTLIKLINLREGFSKKDDSVPPKITLDAMPEGPAKGRLLQKANFDDMLSEYYALLGWDQEGRPTRHALKELGLQNLQGLDELNLN